MSQGGLVEMQRKLKILEIPNVRLFEFTTTQLARYVIRCKINIMWQIWGLANIVKSKHNVILIDTFWKSLSLTFNTKGLPPLHKQL